jgi:hypothetical protein
MDGGTNTIRRLKKKSWVNKYCWDHNTPVCQKKYLNMLGIGHNYFENIREHLVQNDLLSRVHGNIKRMPKWKTRCGYHGEGFSFKVHGLPSPVRNINHVTQSIIFLPATSDFLVGLEDDSKICVPSSMMSFVNYGIN